MGNSFNSSSDYRIEISGWGLDNTFFAERTDLVWAADGGKYVQLHRALPEGALVFVRLLASEPSTGSVPVAYKIQEILPMDRSGRCRMRLMQIHPRSKESLEQETASNEQEDSRRVCGTRETETELQLEEILQ